MENAAIAVRREKNRRLRGLGAALLEKIVPPLLVLVTVVGLWELLVSLTGTPKYLLPRPSDIWQAALAKRGALLESVGTTIVESLFGFAISLALGISLAMLLACSKWVERSVYPYAIVLQTVPIVAVAPIIVIWFGAGMNAIVAISFLLSFFPIFSNTLIGLNSTDKNLENLFFLYNASKLQTLFQLRLPAALPYILGGLKISCSMSIMGAIVGEYIAGIGGGKGGLGYSITVAASRLETSYLFACGLSSSLLGIGFFLAINAASNRLLRSWHESEMKS
ncbi:ABC transporter permease [Cohnella xylanilytica]|uniref:ABC transporter permease n=1 Tax=Cohnella xylanilytica TaxID=557555 RepID=UPI001AFF1885|nr:ABC transporter permease [Cohnella xylanilytica]GIO15893.1 ABC transporter permease [Cohnella xylanilytica]